MKARLSEAFNCDELIELPPPASLSEPIKVVIRARKWKWINWWIIRSATTTGVGQFTSAAMPRWRKLKLDTENNPLFLKGCDLNIAPNTVVYVAAHNDDAYYKGCSCHTGEISLEC